MTSHLPISLLFVLDTSDAQSIVTNFVLLKTSGMMLGGQQTAAVENIKMHSFYMLFCMSLSACPACMSCVLSSSSYKLTNSVLKA